MTCPNCGTDNKSGRKFCINCGQSLAVVATCPGCGSPTEPGAGFCGECGTRLEGAGQAAGQAAGDAPGTATPARAQGSAAGAPPPTATSPVAERRLVSILFADLVGSTTLADGKDPEETRELLTTYFALATDVITRYGGTIEKFIGDAVMAVWGAPTTHEDDAERAVRAALELVDAVKRIGPTIEARAGVLTGEVAVTIGATNQGMVAGDLVNTAARLQSMAAPGTVLVGEATQRAANKAIAFEEAREQSLKGKTAPVPAWRALRVVAEVGGRNRRDTLEAPFVGRDDELRLLKDLFHATTREGRARLVSVIGAAGIGKTRLAWELSKYLDGLVEPLWYHDGRSPAYGEGISFWALGEMVRRRAGLLETDDEATTRAKLAATLAEHVPDLEEQRWIEPALLALLGFGSGARSDELFGAWRTFFERLAAGAPVVLVFEDFHFADSGLIDFVDHLLEWSRNVPIYVVTLARPELVEKRADWGAGKRNFTSLYLEPLPPVAMRALLAGLVPGLPERATKAIVARADGIPLYAVETVRMLLAEGRLKLEGSAYIPTGDLTSLAVPETLTALIASRLDGLAPEDRALIQDAAVLGQSFTIVGLTAVSGSPEAELERRLRALVRRELLTLDLDPRSPERGQYAFVQALIREVAYNTLARPDRKTRHLAAARFFESLGSDELAGALAGQYLAATANAPEGPEREALAAQARVALKGAAERAASLGAHDQAIALFEQGLGVTTEPADRADLLERAGNSAAAAARFDQLERLFTAAIDINRQLGERRGVVRVTALLARALLTGWRLDTARALLEPVVTEYGDLFPDPDSVALEGQLARAYFLHGDLDRALEVAERVLAAAEHDDLLDVLADTLVTKGSALGVKGRVREGVGAIDLGRQIAASIGDNVTLLRALNNLTAGLGEVDYTKAHAANLESVALARKVGVRGAMLAGLAYSGWEEFLSGEGDNALSAWTSVNDEDPDPSVEMIVLSGMIALASLRRQPLDTLIERLKQVTALLSGPQTQSTLAWANAWVAEGKGDYAEVRDRALEASKADADRSSEDLQQAARAALFLGDTASANACLLKLNALGRTPITENRRKMVAAGLAAFAARTSEAVNLYAEVARSWRSIGLAYPESLVGFDMAMLLDPTLPEVRAAVERSREIYRHMGATRALEQLDEAAARRPAARPTEVRARV